LEHNQADEIINPAPTVLQFQKALLNRMKQYGRTKEGKDKKEKELIEEMGYKGIWNAIAPNLKYEVVYPTDGNGEKKVSERIIKKNFIKQAQRLSKSVSVNEDMKFSMRGNILLLLNILEILEVKSINDLLENSLQKPNLLSVISAANVNIENIQDKIDVLENIVIDSTKKKPRIDRLKVCKDWEQILYLTSIILTSGNPYSKKYISQLFNYMLDHYIEDLPSKSHLSIYICLLLDDFNHYFTQEALLHQFCDRIKKLSVFDFSRNNKYIELAPLYLALFFLICQRRFLYTFNKTLSPFRHSYYDKDNRPIINEGVHNMLDKMTLDNFLKYYNNELKKEVKEIIEISLNPNIEINHILNSNPIDLANNIIFLFFNIYSMQVDLSESNYLKFMENVKSLDDLFEKLSIGEPYLFIITEDNIKNIIMVYQKTLNVKDALLRLIR
jgi:hypothetical protein